jgi:hypothetical protein
MCIFVSLSLSGGGGGVLPHCVTNGEEGTKRCDGQKRTN